MPKSLTAPCSVLGTPAYLAPEQARGERVDHRADMYALGVTLHEMLAGARPGASATLPPELKPETVALVKKLLAREPDDRYATYAELRAAIARARRSDRFAPAATWKRAVAFGLDFVLFNVVSVVLVSLVAVAARRDPSERMLWPSLALSVLVFAISEIRWHTTPAKALFRLRTTTL